MPPLQGEKSGSYVVSVLQGEEVLKTRNIKKRKRGMD